MKDLATETMNLSFELCFLNVIFDLDNTQKGRFSSTGRLNKGVSILCGKD